MTETDQINSAAQVCEQLRDRLGELRRERERLRQSQEDLLSLPRSHEEILADIDAALADASEVMSTRAGRIVQRLADTQPWRPHELSGALATLVGKKVSAGGFAHFVADPAALVVLLAPQLRDLLAAQLDGTAPGISADERAERLEAVRTDLAGTEAKIRDTHDVAKQAGFDLTRRRAA